MEALKLIQQIKEKYPQLRICQIIVNATGRADPYFVTDEGLVEKLKDNINEDTKD